MKKIILTWEVAFLQKSYSEYTKVELPILMTTSHNKNGLGSIVNVVSDSNSDNTNGNFFDKDDKDKVKATSQTTINTIVV